MNSILKLRIFSRIILFVLLLVMVFLLRDSAYLEIWRLSENLEDYNNGGRIVGVSSEIKCDADKIKELNISFSFKINKLSGYQNIFQTSDFNQGLRLEIDQGGGGAVLFGHKKNNGQTIFNSLTLKEILEVDVWYDYYINIDKYEFVEAGLIKNSINNPYSIELGPTILDGFPLIVDNVIFGSGFDPTRKFQGDIKNIKFEAACFDYNEKKRQLYFIALLFIFILFFII